MDKKIVNMTNWEIEILGEDYNLSGIADNHPKLGNNVFVSYTSHLVKSELKDDILIYETKNTIYHCPLKYINKDAFKNASTTFLNYCLRINKNKEIDDIIRAEIEIATDAEKKSGFTIYIMKLSEIGTKEMEKMKQQEKERLENIAKKFKDCIYLEVSNISSGNTLSYNIDGECGICEPDVHIGMFDDSILYMIRGIIDFRYFPGYDSMTSYHWSDNIKNVIIKNMKNYSIFFNGKEIKPKETKYFTNDDSHEGLISPDCVTGKSILNNK